MTQSKARELVSSNPVVVFSKTYCPFCHHVQGLLSKTGARFKVIELDEESDGKALQSALAEWTGHPTVPIVFIGGKCIGGSDAMTTLHEEGKLKSLLTRAGAC